MNHFFKKEFTFDRTVRIIFALLLLCTFFFGVSLIWEMLRPFLLAVIFAYAVLPLVYFFQYRLRLKSRGLSVTLVFILLFSAITFAFLYLIPTIKMEISKTITVLSSYNEGKSLIEILVPERLHAYVLKNVNLKDISRNLSVDRLLEGLKSILGQVDSVVQGTISFVSWGLIFAMGLAYFIFVLLDFEGLGEGIINLAPLRMREQVRSIGHELNFYMNAYFRGQALVALCVTILLSIGFYLINLPMAMVMAIFIGVLNFVPYMQLLGILPLGLCAVLMSIQSDRSLLYSFFLAYGVLAIMQFIQDSFIVPHIMGNKMGIRPSLVLLSLSIWGYLFGFIGLLIALPTTMMLYSLYMRYVLKDQAYIKSVDEKLRVYDKKSKS